MPSSRILRAFYSHFQFKLIISKSKITIMTKSSSDDAKSIDNPTLLMVGSTINACRFNKHCQLIVLNTCIYYFIWQTHISIAVASGLLVIAYKLEPCSASSPGLFLLLWTKIFIIFFHSASSNAHLGPHPIGLQETPINERQQYCTI